jgi:succinate dehydrogenase/fumarate reductase flavoprotein subunit
MEVGRDTDFGKPTPLVHDTRAGLRINGKCQVMDLQGEVIPGLYCGGESAGGFNQYGLGRCTAQGYIAGTYAAAERSKD